jgi:hypothetical protein
LCGNDSRREPEQLPILSDAFEYSLWFEDNLDEDYSQVVYGFGNNIDSSGDTDSGLRAMQSSSPLSFEVKRKLRKEAIIIELESSSSSPNYTSYFTDSHSKSDKEEEEEEDSITAVVQAASQASPPDNISNNIAL